MERRGLMKVFPVVHINESGEAVTQATHALDLGADGVYLINHWGNTEELFDTFNKLDIAKPKAFIGMNLLDLRPLDACRVMKNLHDRNSLQRIPNSLWADNALTETRNCETLNYIRQVGGMESMSYLGGISFKYTTTYTEEPMLAYNLTLAALDRVDVVTTSGAGTGTPPTVAKIAAMKSAASNAGKPLAVASGIDSNNIGNFEGIVDEVLVSSSVETTPFSGIFDAKKLKLFIELAHNL